MIARDISGIFIVQNLVYGTNTPRGLFDVSKIFYNRIIKTISKSNLS